MGSETPRYTQVSGEAYQSVDGFGRPLGEWVKASDYDALQAELTAANLALKEVREKVEGHNAECDALCTNQAENCRPFTDRGRRCPDCPKDWRIDDTRSLP